MTTLQPFYSFQIILFLAPIFCVNKSESYEICYKECALPLNPLKLRSSNVEIMVFRLIERNLWVITFAPIFCVNESESYEICYKECALPLNPLKLRSSNVEIMVFRLIERNLWVITFA